MRLRPRSTLFPYTTLFRSRRAAWWPPTQQGRARCGVAACGAGWKRSKSRSEEHTSELQSRQYLVCRLLLEKKNIMQHLVALGDRPVGIVQKNRRNDNLELH